MCGIAGVLYKHPDRMVEEADIIAMRDTMAHRGPDDAGVYVSGNLGLGHRRLSIVGLSTGHQPMSNDAQTVWIVFNGEIYNYLHLKNELRQKGYRFRTESDTEVIIYLYEEYGEACVHWLNGMFAFAVWDENKRRLLLVRDRLGIKPFYYVETRDAFVFASEIKALLAFPGVQAACNRETVYEYFLFRAVAGEQTLFNGIHSILPGHYGIVENGDLRIHTYWECRRRQEAELFDVDQAEERLHELLSDAVRIRLMSEVPLGTFCSGGVDSSLVTAIAAEAIGHPVNTFSVGFHEAAFDEGHYARTVAQKYGTIHHELKLDSGDFSRLLPELVYLNDEPLNFANSVHIYAISKLAKDFVTVVLTGEGADELFFGYPRHQIPRFVSWLQRVSFLSQPMVRLLALLTKDHRLAALHYYLRDDLGHVVKLNNAVNRPDEVGALLAGSVPRSLPYRERVHEKCSEAETLLSAVSLQDQHTYLVSILNRQDKMSMGASVEARVPFLDYRLVEFANSLPDRVRARGISGKTLVKKVAERYLPREVVHRRKSGFGVPLARWFRENNGLGQLTRDVLDDHRKDEFLDIAHVARLFNQHQKGEADHAEILWTALNFLLWKKRFMTH